MNNEKTKSGIFDASALKYLAVIPMATGHFCSYLSGEVLYRDMHPAVFILANLAVFAPPIFFFFITEGYRYTRSRKKYAARLFIFAFINQIPFCLANYGTLLTWDFFSYINIITTLFLGLMCLSIWDSGMTFKKRVILIVLIDAATVFIQSEWMIFGIGMMLGFHIFREEPEKRFIWFLAMALGMELFQLIFMGVTFYTVSALLIRMCAMMLGFFTVTKLYTGERGKHPAFSKWFFYIFYPLHMFIIYLAKCAMGIEFTM